MRSGKVSAQSNFGDSLARLVGRLKMVASGDRAWFAGLLMVAVVARLYHFTSPPDDLHEWRQTQTLMYAWSYSHGAGLLTPHSNWNGIPSHAGVLEMPIYSVLAYWLSAIFDLLTAGRILSFVFSVVAIFVFYRLCALLNHPRRGVATLLFAFAPVAVFYGHATQPESLLLLLMILTAYCAFRSDTNWWWAVGAAVCLALASTIKPTAFVILFFPLVYLAWKRRQWARQGVVLTLAAIAVLIWSAFVRNTLLAEDPFWYHLSMRPEWLWGPLSVRYSGEFYSTLLTRLLWFLLPLGAVVFVAWAALKRVGDPFWWWWGVGSLASVFIFARLNDVHLYYQLPIVPALAALAAYGGTEWSRQLRFRLIVAAYLVAAVLFGGGELYQENPINSNAGRALAQVSLAGQPVIVMSGTGDQAWWPTVLYYAGRDGWNLPLTADANRIKSLSGAPPCWLVIVKDVPGAGIVPEGWKEIKRTEEYVLAQNNACFPATSS